MPGRRKQPTQHRGHFTAEEVAINEWDEEELRVANEIVDVSEAFGLAMYITVHATHDQQLHVQTAWREFGRRLVAAMEMGRSV